MATIQYYYIHLKKEQRSMGHHGDTGPAKVLARVGANATEQR